MSGRNDAEQRFADALQRLVDREDRATLAALRRGLGKEPGLVPETHPFVLHWVPRNIPRHLEDNWYLVASLFAIHQRNWRVSDEQRFTNLGASFARLSQATDSASIERRFVAILNCDADDLPHHLRAAISLLATHDVPVDFAQLLRDLRWWVAERRTVQRNWARSFWGGQRREESNTVDATEAVAS